MQRMGKLSVPLGFAKLQLAGTGTGGDSSWKMFAVFL